MSHTFKAGDFLVYQLESAFAMLRLLAVDEEPEGRVWHLAGYNEFFPDIESAELHAFPCAVMAALTNEVNSGCPWRGDEVNSGWNWQPTNHG